MTHSCPHPDPVLTEYMAFSSSRALACLMASASSLSFRSILQTGMRVMRKEGQATGRVTAGGGTPCHPGASHSFSTITEHLLHASYYFRYWEFSFEERRKEKSSSPWAYILRKRQPMTTLMNHGIGCVAKILMRKPIMKGRKEVPGTGRTAAAFNRRSGKPRRK